jgi:dTMP kinase
MAQGSFIVVEGADGVGTTTQAQALVDLLNARGQRAHRTAEPSRGPIGLLIRQLLQGDRPRSAVHRELALLFAADRLDHVAREVQPLVDDGVVVVSDRYLLSSLVYQSLDLPLAWVRSLNEHAAAPDVTLWMDLPLSVARERLVARRGAVEVFDDEDTQARVHAAYAAYAPHVGAVRVDAQGNRDDVTARLVAALSAHGLWPS